MDSESGSQFADSAEVRPLEVPPPRAGVVEPDAESGRRAVSVRELAVVGLMVVLADITLFHGQGYAGCAVFFLLAPVLLVYGSRPLFLSVRVAVLGAMLVALVLKLLWSGSGLLVFFGFALTVAMAMTVRGHVPFVVEVIVYASQTIQAGYLGLVHYWRAAAGVSPRVPRGGWLNVGLPTLTALVFGALFILANPDLATRFGEGFDWFVNALRSWLVERLSTPLEVVFWDVVARVTIGLLRPVLVAPPRDGRDISMAKAVPERAPLYTAFHNTLIVVIGLFAVYLVFEFATLWFREFPPGFYYSGYAHEGAAWLTVALALATVILSLVFRGSMLSDPRLPRLRRLAWLWSLENILLAIAVYNRLFIYIGFNGMTRMRIVGLFGISAVLVGFVVVLVKIAHNHSFLWLIRRQLWTLSITVYLFALTPLDTIVVSYNVSRILNGELAPSVQISVQPIDSEGVALLEPLLECSDDTIREGGAALLARRELKINAWAERQQHEGWTSYQIADDWAWEKLREQRNAWAEYRDPQRRDEALEAFHAYVYQWY